MIELNRKVRFSHPDFNYSGTTYTEYLFGSIGLKVNADIRVEVSWGTEDVNMIFYAATNTIERIDGGSFLVDGFRDNESLVITGTSLNNWTIGTNAITVTDSTILVSGGTLLFNETVICTIRGTQPIISMDFYPNLINNSTDFSLVNLTDRETIPRYYADTISTDSASPTTMSIATNSRGWVTPSDTATIYKSSSSTTILQIFIISHTFNITPIFLANQLSNIQNGIPPAAGSYKDIDCLKYVFTIDGKFSAYNPDIVHTTDGNVEFPKGQTGWFNEFINGRPTIWTKRSIAYSDNATGAGLSEIDYCKIVNVDARVVCQVAAGDRYIVQILYLPLNEDRYVNTANDFKTNFIYERAVVDIAGGTVQGENTGDYHFLKTVIATALDANSTKITFQIDFSDTLIDFFDTQDSDNLNYIIFITAQNGTNSTPP